MNELTQRDKRIISYRSTWLYDRDRDGGIDNPNLDISLGRMDTNKPDRVFWTSSEVYPDEFLKTSTERGYLPDRTPTTIDSEKTNSKDGVYDHHSYRTILHSFAMDVTSTHGLPHVFRSSNLISRCIWAVLFLVGISLFIWQTTVLFQLYLDYPKNVKIEVVTNSELKFPSISICNTNKLRRSAVESSKHRQALVVDRGVTLPYYEPCIEGDFMCNTGRTCIKQYLRCDGINHCKDFSDEFNCVYGECNNDDLFKCNNGSASGICISRRLECDRAKDCYDGEDEDNCECKSREFKCDVKGGCIPKEQVCDNKFDCTDESDELTCEPEKCSETGGYLCVRDNKCIPRSYLCDGFNDCSTGDDEEAATCSSVAQTTIAPSLCDEDQFQCDGERCIHYSWRCDNYVDCSDGTDEQGCGDGSGSGGSATCNMYQFQCLYTYGCINVDYKCDGNYDCVDGSDEEDCECDGFQCLSDSTCIHVSWECDQYTDCSDGSDELNCDSQPCYSTPCGTNGYCIDDSTNDDGYTCCCNEPWTGTNCEECNGTTCLYYGNNVCITELKKCNGKSECEDGSDESIDVCPELYTECYVRANGKDYSGTVAVTDDGRACDVWSNTDYDGPSNYCRNLDSTPVGPWCIVTSGNVQSHVPCSVTPPIDPSVDTCKTVPEVRLVDGPATYMGRVEINYKGSWGSVCDDDWDMEDATVICKMLGYASVVEAHSYGYFGSSSGDILLDDLNCLGTEINIADCIFPGWGVHNCAHSEDAGVTCYEEGAVIPDWTVPDYEYQQSGIGLCGGEGGYASGSSSSGSGSGGSGSGSGGSGSYNSEYTSETNSVDSSVSNQDYSTSDGQDPSATSPDSYISDPDSLVYPSSDSSPLYSYTSGLVYPDSSVDTTSDLAPPSSYTSESVDPDTTVDPTSESAPTNSYTSDNNSVEPHSFVDPTTDSFSFTSNTNGVSTSSVILTSDQTSLSSNTDWQKSTSTASEIPNESTVSYAGLGAATGDPSTVWSLTDVTDTTTSAPNNRKRRNVHTNSTNKIDCALMDGFLCSSGECIPDWMTCNNFPDCEDGDDEVLCGSASDDCYPGEVKCVKGEEKCIAATKECDGVDDCQHGEDENRPYCTPDSTTLILNASCPVNYFQCKVGLCVHDYYRCNSAFDCFNEKDEENCTGQTLLEEETFPEGWYDPYTRYTDNPNIYTDFIRNFYNERGFGRVKGEEPPDWDSFITFSSTPDYSDLEDVLKLGEEEIDELGHRGEDLILQCTYDQRSCNASFFSSFQDDRYGNCYIFNHGRDGSSIVNSTRTGAKYGLKLTLFLEQEEFISIYGRDAGVKVIMDTPARIKFPQDEGIVIKPGAITFVSLRYNVVSKLGNPYGECISEADDYKENIYNAFGIEGIDLKYDTVGCEKSCVINKIKSECGCTDTVTVDPAERCGLLNTTQDVCRQLMYYFFNQKLLDCNCLQQCDKEYYSKTISQSTWPSDIYLNQLLRSIHSINDKTRYINDKTALSKDIARLEVYFEELNYQSTTEEAAYLLENLISDIGGTAGLYIGISIISFCEFIELVFQMLKYTKRWMMS